MVRQNEPQEPRENFMYLRPVSLYLSFKESATSGRVRFTISVQRVFSFFKQKACTSD